MKRLLSVDWLLRVPLAIVFLQQGLSKLPISVEDAASFELPMLVWVFVVLFVLSNFPSCALVLVFAGLGWKNGGSYSMFVIFLFPLYFSGSESAWNA